ncbi:MAG: hypothetical protein JXR70_16005 [Spirochaetales bacterium]|nr:hypothetical protein [Spirochaetales bacterium]
MSRYQEIKEYYQTLKDQVLLDLIEYEFMDLEPEAISALKSEILDRVMDTKWIKAIDFATQPMSEEAFALFARRVERQNCPYCGQSERPLSASLIRKLTGQVIRVYRDYKYILGCPDCIMAKMKEAEDHNKLKGWFAFPMGVFETLFAFFYHRYNRRLFTHGHQTRDFYRYLRVAKAKVYYQFF